jgi:Ca2+-binding RTX toxin-like protein
MMRRAILMVAMMSLTLLVASGVALAVTKIGTNGPDTLRGTNGADNLLGNGANDALFALGGRDNLLGGEGKDWVLGGNERRASGGDKHLVGGPGNDGVLGGKSSDIVVGGSGNDYVYGHTGSDRVVGQEGDDLVWGGTYPETARDVLSAGDGEDVVFVDNRTPAKDIVSCGGSFDRVGSDSKDVVAPDCEKVFVGAAASRFFHRLEESGYFDHLSEEVLAPYPTG